MGKGRIIGLMVIVLLASASEAYSEVYGTFEIGMRYVDGLPFDPDVDVLDIGDSLYLSIYTDEGFVGGSEFGYYWALVCDPSLSTITGGEAGPDAPPYVVFYGSAGGLFGVPGDGQRGKMGSPDYFEPGLYLDNFLYSPQSVGEVTVSFWELTEDVFDTPPYGIVDSVAITQVPEPMSVVLLGLGGLLLYRRTRTRLMSNLRSR